MIRLIAAVDRRLGIGKHGGQPWNIPEDEAYFAECTKSHGACILTGSVTFKTFKKPLPDRTNYVLTSHDEPIEGAELVHDLAGFLESFSDKDLWVIGGANVFQEVMDLGKADELYLTHIDADFNCDRFFPAYEDKFRLIEKGEEREQNGFHFSLAKYAKV
jgi:dihydrofolate reductase